MLKQIILTLADFFVKTKYDTDKSDWGKKVPGTSELVKKLDFNGKITEIENKYQV